MPTRWEEPGLGLELWRGQGRGRGRVRERRAGVRVQALAGSYGCGPAGGCLWGGGRRGQPPPRGTALLGLSSGAGVGVGLGLALGFGLGLGLAPGLRLT